MDLCIILSIHGLSFGRHVNVTLGIHCSAVSVKMSLNFSLIIFMLTSVLIKDQLTESNLFFINCMFASSYFHIVLL